MPCLLAGLVETDLAKDLVTRVKGLVGEETAAASYYVRLRKNQSLPSPHTSSCAPDMLSSLLTEHSQVASRRICNVRWQSHSKSKKQRVACATTL